MLKNLDKKLEFIELMDEMKNIKRAIYLKNGSQETVAEHTFHIAMMLITLIDDFPELDLNKCFYLALIHDIVEIYAGDTVLGDTKMEKTQKEREEEAIKKMDSEFGKVIPNLISLIKEYENIESEEAKFIRSLDGIAPIIQIVMEGGQSWIDWKLTAEKVKGRAYGKCLNKKLEKILDIYFEKAEKGNMFYIEKN